MNLLIVAATAFEILPLITFLDKEFEKVQANQYRSEDFNVSILITGVGSFSTIYTLTKILNKAEFDLAINVGIAGALNLKLSLGDVVNLLSDKFGDVGIEEANGSFTSIFDLELINPNEFPFRNEILYNLKASEYDFLPTAKGVTVNTVHGSTKSIQQFKSQNDADIESMEGAAFFYVCLQEKQSCLQIRSISNYVEERNRENWVLDLAIVNLNEVVKDIIKIFIEK